VKLAPSRDGVRLAALDRGRIRILDLTGASPEVTLVAEAAFDLVLFEQQLWVVDGDPPTLRVYTLDMREIATIPLPPGRGLVRAPYGPAAALWLSDPPIMIADHGGGPSTTVLDEDAEPADLLVPLSAGRQLRFRDDHLSLLDAGRARWSQVLGHRLRPIAMGAMFDGRSIAAVFDSGTAESGAPGTQHLVLLDLREGRLQHRLALHGVTGARFTARRGLAVLLTGPGQLVIVDLRFGKVLRQYQRSQPILDLAIDDAAEHLVLRLGDELVDLHVSDLIAGRSGTSSLIAGEDEAPPAEEASAAEPPVAPAPSFPPEPEPPPPAPEEISYDVGPLVGLDPRAQVPTCTTAAALAMLDRYRQLVAALAARAIARGWDTGTIAFVDEGRPPFEREVAALVLGSHGHAQNQLRAADEAVAEAHRGLRAADAELDGRLAPLARLAIEFRLSALAQHLLVLIAAPSIWGELARLYGILANDEHRPLCDELLLVQLSGGADRHAISRALDRDQPLIRNGLVRIAGDRARPFGALAADPLVLKILRDDALDADLEDGTLPVPVGRDLEQLHLPRPEVARALRTIASTPVGTPSRIVVRGRLGSGRRSLVAAMAARADRRLGTIDAGRLVRDKRIDVLPALLRRCALRGWIPLVDGLEAIGGDDVGTRDTVRDILREHPGPLAVRLPHDAEPPLPAGFVMIDLPPLTIGVRADHWAETLREKGLMIRDVDELAARFQIGPGVVERVVGAVAQQGVRADGDGDREIDRAIRQHLESRLGQVANRVTRLVNWSQVILPPDIQDSILELIARIRHRRTVYDTWGFDQVMSTSRGVTALFQGGPGTGKTLVAGAIANELGLDLYRIDLSRVMSKWIGETEQNLAKVFDAAEEGQAIILFDEADSLFAKRTEVKSSVDRYANLEVNYLLQRLDTFEGIAILTTNFGTSIDQAFKRRLSFRLTFPFPDDETRELLWKAHLPEHLPRAGDFNLADLARRFRMSGGYIRNAALRAAFLAAEEQTPLTQGHLERAIRAEFREIGKLADTGILE
jgi:hypothetical protein